MKISELAGESGLPVSTVRHYINEGLLGEPRKKSRNMAYYHRDTLPKISLIKRLQEELFLPLNIIKKLFKSANDLTFEEYNLLVEVRRRLQEQTDLLPEMINIPFKEVLAHLEITEQDLKVMEACGAISPKTKKGLKYCDEIDYGVIKAFAACRASGLRAELGFAASDINMYLEMLRELVRKEARLFIKRVSGERSVDEIVEIVNKGLPATNELISYLHHKCTIDVMHELEQQAKKKMIRGRPGTNKTRSSV